VVLSVVVFWGIGLSLIVAQTTLLEYLPQWLGRPDLLFVLVAFLAYRFAWIPGILVVFSLSWVVDVISAIYLGLYPLACLAAFSALKSLSNKSPVKESTYQIPLVGLIYFLMQILFYFVNSLLLPDILPQWSWPGVFQRTVLVVLSAIPLFVLFHRLNESLLKRRLRGNAPRRRPPRPV
jgi:rod shape-determining protein MreD